MANRFRSHLISLAILISLPPAATAQNNQLPTFRTKTDVVLVPVLVRSKNAPVEGLKPEQFSVTEDGKPQKIASVELIKTAGTVTRRQSPNEFSNELVSPGPARLTIIGLDMINTHFLDQAFGRQQVLKYLATSMAPNEQVALFGMYRDGSVRLLHDLSSDPTELANAIKGMSGVLPNTVVENRTNPSLSRDDTERRLMGQRANPNLGSGDPNLQQAADEEQALQAFKESTSGNSAIELRRNMDATMETMRQIGEAYSGVPGRKAFVWITGSFPFDIAGSGDLISPRSYFMGNTQQTANYYATHSGALPPMPETSVVVDDAELRPVRQEFKALMQDFAAANVVLYPLDARGLMTLNYEAADGHTNQLIQQLDRTRTQDSQLTMDTIAKMTGGKSCYNKNEVASCLRDASQDSQEYYLVSYYRDKKNNKQGWRKIAVKVNQPDVDVRARTGYYFGTDQDKNARSKALSAALHSSVPFSSLPFSARFLGMTPQGQNRLVKYEIFIPPSTVDAAEQGEKFQVEVVAVASSKTNPKVDQVSETLGGNLPPQAVAAIHQQGIAYNNVLKLPPGEYDVRFMVVNTATNDVGSVIAPLKVD